MTHILTRGDTAANWAAENPILMEREFGFETDTLKAKWGDGVSAWNLLDYAVEPIPNLANYALLNSPTFTGNPKAPTPSDTADNTTSIATTTFVQAQKTSPVFTGNPTAPTPVTTDNDTSIATTAFVQAQKASPVFTGNPTAPTPVTTDNDTSIATTAFVKNAIAAAGTWQVHNPTLFSMVVGSTGSAVTRYDRFGNTVHFETIIAFGGTGVAVGTDPAFTVPFAMFGGSSFSRNIRVVLSDASGNPWEGIGYFNTLTSIVVGRQGTNGILAQVTSSTPFPWTAGDAMFISGTYECAP